MLHRLLHSDTFRAPQFAAAALLLVYLLQCAWLVRVQSLHAEPDSDQALRIYQGLQQWRKGVIAGTPESLRSEAVTGIPSAARAGHLRVRDGYDQDRSPLYYLVAATPYLFFGLMLGASLWYVARRLYGNAGGYIALTLYCFSPAMILNVAGTQSLGEMGAVWGAFGTVFTTIAVAHTLYAPREVVLWNWRRILLLGLSLALVAGDQFSLAPLAIVILPLMFWVAPVRPRAVFAIWTTAIAVALTLLFAAYFFEPGIFWRGMRHALWIDFDPAAFGTVVSYRNARQTIFAGSPALMLALPAAVVAYLGWKRSRYFGNTTPFLIALLLLVLALGTPDFPGRGFHLTMLVFLFVFVAGVFADLLETPQSMFVMAALVGLLSASAIWNVYELARLM
jgi:MFS family permease